jgi:hypothetical protein
MLSPLPRRSGWAYHFARSPRRISLPRKGCRVGLRIVLFEACSAFTRVTACTLALSPIRDTHSEGFSYFVTSIAAPVASGWSGRRVGFAPTGKRRLVTAHTPSGRAARHNAGSTPGLPQDLCGDFEPASNDGPATAICSQRQPRARHDAISASTMARSTVRPAGSGCAAAGRLARVVIV